MRRCRQREPAFTGNCPVREHTSDGAYLGRCDYATYDGRCPRHGDIGRFLRPSADLSQADDRLLPRLSSREQEARS